MSKLATVYGLIRQIRAAGLEASELRQLAAACEALATDQDQLGYTETPETTENRTLTNGHGRAGGHIELKTIGGHGPYEYLRFWSGGKHRSVYLGKPKAN